jgi:hypothetical protein
VSSDTVGVPWAGRSLNPQPFAGDDGGADPGLADALAAHAGGRASEADVVAALGAARVLVPVVAAIGEDHPLPDHVRGDAGAQMSLPLLAGPGGRRALPVFSGVDALAAWDATARPVPVEASRAALSAVDEGCDVMVLDPASPGAFVVRRPAVWALAQGRSWAPAAADPEVVATLAEAMREVPAVRGVHCEPGQSSELRVVVALEPGLDQAALTAVLAQVRELIAAEPLLAERAESVELRAVAVATDP